MKPISTAACGVIAAAMTIMAGCQTAPPASEAKPGLVPDPACVVTQASYDHIHDRHCTPGSGASQLLPQYCTQAGMQNFCTMVQTAANQTRTVQPDGRIRYDSNLGVVVGTAGEKCGRLVITSAASGVVITEFPELANAPTPPPCR